LLFHLLSGKNSRKAAVDDVGAFLTGPHLIGRRKSRLAHSTALTRQLFNPRGISGLFSGEEAKGWPRWIRQPWPAWSDHEHDGRKTWRTGKLAVRKSEGNWSLAGG